MLSLSHTRSQLERGGYAAGADIHIRQWKAMHAGAHPHHLLGDEVHGGMAVVQAHALARLHDAAPQELGLSLVQTRISCAEEREQGMSTPKQKVAPPVVCYGRGDRLPPGEYTCVVNTTSRSQNARTRQLSPFLLGPCEVQPFGPEGQGQACGRQDERVPVERMENAWQFSKVYRKHADAEGWPSDQWRAWSTEGFASSKPHRFPMGAGAKPLYCLHHGRRLGYVQSRIEVYAPLYAWCVETYCPELLEELRQRHAGGEKIALFDFDGHCHHLAGLSLKDVLYNTRRKMGHSFVLAGLIQGDRFWETEYDPSLVTEKSVPRWKGTVSQK